jgi:hypothetical protein
MALAFCLAKKNASIAVFFDLEKGEGAGEAEATFVLATI